MSRLSALCHSLEEQKNNYPLYCQLICQFLQANKLNSDIIFDISHDSALDQFLNHIFNLVTHSKFPSPSDGPIPNQCIQCLQYLIQIGSSNPDVLSKMAQVCPGNDIPQIFFSNNIEHDAIVDPQSTHLLTPLRFLQVISSSHFFIISSSSALHTLFVTLFSTLKIPHFTALSAGIISSLAHNSPCASTFLKALPNFFALKAQLVNLLPSNDHSIVVAASSALTGLFNMSADSATLLKVAHHAILSPPRLLFGTGLATWSILDISQWISISDDLIISLLKFAFNSNGMTSLFIFSCISELQRTGYDIKRIILSVKDFLFLFFDYVLTVPEDFLAVSVCEIIRLMFECEKTIKFGTNITKLFSRGLEMVLSPPADQPESKTEAAIVLLRVLSRSIESRDKISKILCNNEDSIFLGFQRNVENNQAFIALNFFIFLCSVESKSRTWKKRLQKIISESQLPALIVHVLTHSTNREVISDGAKAMHIISNGLNDNEPSPLFEYLISGFYVINKNNIKEKEDNNAKIDVKLAKLTNQLNEYKDEHLDLEQRLDQMNQEKTRSGIIIKSQEENLSHFNQQNEQLHSLLDNKDNKINELKNEIKIINEENSKLKKQNNQKDNDIKNFIHNTEELKAEIKELQNTRLHLTEVTTQRDDLIKRVDELQKELSDFKDYKEAQDVLFNNEKDGRLSAESKLYQSSVRISLLQSKLKELEESNNDGSSQIKRYEGLIRKKDERISASEVVNRNLRSQLDSISTQIPEFRKLIKSQKKQIEDLQKQILALETANNEKTTIHNFIHQMTESKLASIEDDSEVQ